MQQPQSMSQPYLLQLQFPKDAWQSISLCLMSHTESGNPYPEVIPMPLGNNLAVLIGGTITLNLDKLKRICSHQQLKFMTLTPIPPMA